MSEINQNAETRSRLFKKIEKHFGGKKLVTFFTSFKYPVDITDDDCDMLQSVLKQMDLTQGLVLMVSSPGGDGLAAERIVNACKAYSGTNSFSAIVPGKAKSAGTIICMGAEEIFMAPVSELGPVDPQIIRREESGYKVYSAHSLVTGYDQLFADATNSTGPLEPYLQQLYVYDHRDISTYRTLIKLSEDISVKILRSGMLSGISESDIKDKIEVFLNPDAGTLSHGRPIYAADAKPKFSL